jgi:uncharacterized protein
MEGEEKMIKKLKEENRAECMAFVKEMPAENLFIIGDIETYGFDSDFQEVWGDYDHENKLQAVLLRYRYNYIIYAPSSFDIEGIAQLLDEKFDHNMFVSGISTCVYPVVELMKNKPKQTREFYYAKCEKLQPLEIPNVEIKKMTIEAIPRVLKQHDQIADFVSRPDRGEGLRKNFETGVARGFYIEDGEEIVSSAMTTAENSVSAMIVGVCTIPGYEKRGYASAIMTKLCEEVLAEGKYLCLFYDNPKAGNIYKRLGFVDIGKWVMNTY